MHLNSDGTSGPNRNRNGSSKLLAAASLCALASSLSAAHAQGDQPQAVSIESDTLSAAIVELSRETGSPIFAASELTNGKRVEPFSGEHTVSEALDKLLAGTGLIALTDPNGNFVLAEIQKASQATPIYVAASDDDDVRTTQPENLNDETLTQDVIIVTGIRDSLSDALNSKRNAINLTEAISSQDIGKFPDQNIAEGLQRVPGVAITRVAGEGQQVILRGLAPEFTRVTLNGQSTPSGNRGREFDFDVFASELFSGATISKAPIAEVIEGGVAGSIDLRTPRPFDYTGFTAAGSGQAVITPRADATDPRAYFLVSNTFGDSFGALFSISYSESSERADGVLSVGWAQRNFDIGNDGSVEFPNVFYPQIPIPVADLYDRERLGLTGALQFRPNENFELNIDALYGQFDRRQERLFTNARLIAGNILPISLTVDSNNSIVTGTFDNVAAQSSARLLDNEQDFAQLSVDGAWRTGNWILSGVASYSEAKDDEVRDIDITLENAGLVTLDLSNPSFFPEIFFDFDLTDPAQYEFGRLRNSPALVEDEGFSLQSDAKRDFSSGIVSALKFGARYEDRKKSSSGQSLSTQAFRGSVDVNSISRPLPFDDFASGLGAPAGFPRNWIVPDIEQAIAVLGIDAFVGADDLGNTFSVQEQTLAGYAQLDLQSTILGLPFAGNFGVRVVKTDQTSVGTQFQGGVPSPIEVNNDYTDVLPSANLRFELNEDLVLRLAGAKVITRPTLNDLSPRRSLDVLRLTASQGNPNLDPFRATQFDAAIEWYFVDEALISAAFFYKDIESFISPLQQSIPLFGIATLNNEGESVDGATFRVTQPVNGDGGSVTGLELSYQQPFTFLPAPFDGFGAIANYTYVDSEGTVTSGNTTVTLPLTQQSKNSYNLVGYYEKNGFAFRAAYNWRDEFLITPFSPGNQQVYREPAGFLDLFASFDVNENFVLTFEALNVTDTELYEYEGLEDRFSVYEATGPRYFVGARFNF